MSDFYRGIRNNYTVQADLLTKEQEKKNPTENTVVRRGLNDH